MLRSREIARFITPPRACSYLPGEQASLEYRVHATMSPAEYGDRLRRGWRRHGAHFFRPRCADCLQCRSLRVVASEFQPSKSQRRILRRNADVSVVLQPPTVTPQHIAVFNAYHADMTARRGWSENWTTAEDYENSFLIGHWPFAREMLYLRAGQLLGVGLMDVAADAVSSVYFYHDPAWREDAPGTFSVLQEMEFCRRTGRQYNYLGYWIEACPSMAYKSRFTPHEILEGYVDEPEEPVWRRV